MNKERTFRAILILVGMILSLLLLAIFLSLLWGSFPSIKALGWKFFYSEEWNPITNKFGALPFLIGTLVTSFLALAISFPFSLAVSIYLGEYMRAGKISTLLKVTIDLISAVPSVIYGFWGLIILVPLVRNIEMKLNIPPYGVGIFTATLILSVMVIPYSATIVREVIELVPDDLKEAAYSLGATKYEVIKDVVLPYAKSGIFAGLLLSLGRALGETMAVTMVIGNNNKLPKSLFAPANTMASLIANEFTEAVGNVYLSSLIEMGLLLFIVTAIINIIGKYIINRTTVQMRE